MSWQARQPGAGAALPNIEAQLAVTHNPVFPFSSPNVDDRPSPSSDRDEHTRYLRSPVEFNPSRPILPESIKGPTSRNPYLQAAKGNNKGTSTFRLGVVGVYKKKSNRARRRPGLQVITDLQHARPRLGDVVLNQVAAKHPEQARNKARSVISQKGIRILASPLAFTQPPQGYLHDKDLTSKSGNREQDTDRKLARTRPERKRRQNEATSKSSVVFGLCLPEHEAQLLEKDGVRESVALSTPELTRSASPSSVYSKETFHVNRIGAQGPFNPRPQLSRHYASSDSHIKRRLSSESQEQILPDSCDTARPKSQGWWNLVVSPILSRAGTLKNSKPFFSDSAPPVPPVPMNVEKGLTSQTPVTVVSPDTPRRQGLANIRASSWSRWTDWEDEKVPLDNNELDDNGSDNKESDNEPDNNESSPTRCVPAVPHDYLTNTRANPVPSLNMDERKREGLAAEYYHACAVDQLSDTPYFECVNHSCLHRLPALQSIYDDVKSCSGDKTKSAGDEDEHLTISHLPTASNSRSVGTSSISVAPDRSGRKVTTIKSDVQMLTQGSMSPTESEIDAGEIVSPNIRQANVAAFSKAKTVHSRETSPVPPLSNANSSVKQLNIAPIRSVPDPQSVQSPGPISPDAARSIAPAGAMPMAPLQSVPAENSVPLLAPIPQVSHALVQPYQPPPAAFLYPYAHSGPSQYTHTPLPPQQYFLGYPAPAPAPTDEQPCNHRSVSPSKTKELALVDLESNKKIRKQRLKKTESDKKEKKTKASGFLCCCCFGRHKADKNKKKRWIIGIAAILIIVIILCVLLAVLLTRGHAGPIDGQWLNLTGYPAMPTGISTIAQPNLVASQNQCTEQPLLWSCALPKEDQAGIGTNQPDQPNFRFQIRFQNGTVPASMTIPISSSASKNSDDSSFVPNPTPPDRSEQIFLGNTTDNVLQPFEGEVTPFFITFMSASVVQSTTNATKQLSTRQLDGLNGAINSIPPPALDSNGNAAPASLLPTTPFPISQPIKLYNRGLRDEHYGFYIYYDKSIFLSISNSSSSNGATTTASNQNGGSTKQAANFRCTWSQTRFVVKMYTNRAFGASLLAGSTTNNTVSQSGAGPTSATNFNRPGSFPYPTTILLDRHGGNINKKLVYCYGMNNQQIVTSQKSLVLEDRSVGGVPINPSPFILNSTFNSNVGGMDGGTGGCGCTWQNWS